LPLRATSFVLKQKKQKFKPLERLFAAQAFALQKLAPQSVSHSPSATF